MKNSYIKKSKEFSANSKINLVVFCSSFTFCVICRFIPYSV